MQRSLERAVSSARLNKGLVLAFDEVDEAARKALQHFGSAPTGGISELLEIASEAILAAMEINQTATPAPQDSDRLIWFEERIQRAASEVAKRVTQRQLENERLFDLRHGAGSRGTPPRTEAAEANRDSAATES